MARPHLTRQAVTMAARKFGVEPDYREDGDLGHEITIEAPAGHVWTGSGVHELVICGADATPWSALYRDALARMADGVEPCDAPDCEWCGHGGRCDDCERSYGPGAPCRCPCCCRSLACPTPQSRRSPSGASWSSANSKSHLPPAPRGGGLDTSATDGRQSSDHNT